MEVFAGAANVRAAVSLTPQRVDTLENMEEFWKGVKNALEEVVQIIYDLELLEGTLNGVGKAHVPFDLSLPHTTSWHLIVELSCTARAEQTLFRSLMFFQLFNNLRDIFVECRNLQAICKEVYQETLGDEFQDGTE